jgi:hypothetical protein
MRYIENPTMTIDAEQWFKNGDHSQDNCEVINPGQPDAFLSEGKMVRYFRNPNIPGDTACEHCGQRMHVHGWIDPSMWNLPSWAPILLQKGADVCPGSFVIKFSTEGGDKYYVMREAEFKSKYIGWPALNPTEAVMGFASWLTTREEPTIFSSRHNCSPIVELIKKFCTVQKLGNVKDNWPANMIPMGKGDGIPSEDISLKFIPKQAFKNLVELLQRAANLVGNPGTNISGSTDIACQEWQKDLAEYVQLAGLEVLTYGPHTEAPVQMTGAEMISFERQRQIENEGHSVEADDVYKNGELYDAAECYEFAGLGRVGFGPEEAPAQWPWPETDWKPSSQIRNLVKAGALYRAEETRINRLPEGVTSSEAHKARLVGLADKIEQLGFMIDELKKSAPELPL